MRDGWKLRKIGEVSEIINGGTPKTKTPEFWNGGIAWITPKNLGALESEYITETERTVSELGLKKSSAKLMPAGSVILSTRAPIGHLAIAKIPISTNQGCRGLIPSNELNNKYLYYFLMSRVDLLNDLGTGTTFKELSTRNLSGVEIPIPSLPEQKRIVAILDEAFASIDQAKAKVERNLQNAQELFQSKLNEVFTQQGEGWVMGTLPEISENLDRIRVPITKSKRKPGPYPYYGASGIVDYVDDYLFDEELLLISEDGANLLARTYPIAFRANGKYWVNNHAHVLRFESPYTMQFIEWYFASIKIDEYVSGMAQPKLSQSALNRIPVPICPVKVKERVVNTIQGINSMIEDLQEAYDMRLTNLAELKTSILQKAFTGELTSLEHEVI